MNEEDKFEARHQETIPAPEGETWDGTVPEGSVTDAPTPLTAGLLGLAEDTKTEEDDPDKVDKPTKHGKK